MSYQQSLHQQTAECDMNHGRRDIQSHIRIAHQLSPLQHPAEGALAPPALQQMGKALLANQPAHGLDHQVEEYGLVAQLAPVVRAVGKKMPDPRPATFEGNKHPQRTG